MLSYYTHLYEVNNDFMKLSMKQIWQEVLTDLVTDIDELCSMLKLDRQQVIELKSFPLRVPRSFIARMKPGDPHDPLLRQVLPISEELTMAPGYSHDPLGEEAANKVKGLLHKYHGRVLLTVTGACGVHCRYCFRRHFPYQQNQLDNANWQRILTYIAEDPSITEVILSGGDPLMLKDQQLSQYIKDLEQIPHLKWLRFHSRMPIVIPERITKEFIQLLQSSRLSCVMVVHANHANEIDEAVGEGLKRLREAQIPVLNQSVLLRGVNDEVATLINLSERLFSYGVQPYYLHLLDKVAGAQHFEVPLERAQQLYQTLLEKLPGYLVPKLVKEQAGALSKIPILP